MRVARIVVLAAGMSGACAEPAIEMRLQLPPKDVIDRFDTACVGAVQVFVRGEDRGAFPTAPTDPGRPADDRSECVEVSGAEDLTAVRAAIAGRFSLDLPDSGLVGVDVRASTGSCDKELRPGDTVFYGTGTYAGGGALVVELAPNVACNASRTEVVRPVDLLALTRSGVCPAPIADSANAFVDAATIHPAVVAPGLLDFGDAYAQTSGGVATLPLFLTPDLDTCAALVYEDRDELLYSASCARRANGVCSAPGQLELPILDGAVALASWDLDLSERHGGAVIGGVWGADAGGTKHPISGATVVPVEADAVSVVYADYPVGATRLTSLAGASATNASGLFFAYVGTPREVVVSAPGYRDELVRLGSAGEPAAALILLNPR